MIKEFLQTLREEFPETQGQHHSITLMDDSESLQLNIMLGDRFQTIYLTEDEMKRPVSLVSEIKELMEGESK